MPTVPDNRHIQSFHGMDVERNVSDNIDYAIGVRAINLGRRHRRPLEPRRGLRPVDTSNGRSEVGGPIFAMGSLLQGDRLHLVVRAQGGTVLAIKDVKPKAYV